MSKRAFHKTVVTVTILSEEQLEFDDLAELGHMITNGDAVGDYEVESDNLTPKQAADLAHALRSDPEFFGLTDNGEDVEADYTVTVAFLFESATYGDRTRKLEGLLGKGSDGAGTDGNERDVSWYFKTLPGAVNAFQKFHKLRWLTRCSLTRG
jgi:hypothetical protein